MKTITVLAGLCLLYGALAIAPDTFPVYSDLQLVPHPNSSQGRCVQFKENSEYKCPAGYRIESSVPQIFHSHCVSGTEEVARLKESIKTCTYTPDDENMKNPVCVQAPKDCKRVTYVRYRPEPPARDSSKCPEEFGEQREDKMKVWTFPEPFYKSEQFKNIQYWFLTSARNFTLNQIQRGQYHQILDKGFDKDAETKIIIHGFLNDGVQGPGMPITTAYIKRHTLETTQYGRSKPINVIVVDWGSLSGLFDMFKLGLLSGKYAESASVVNFVGARVANLIEMLVVCGGAKPEKIHLIGHSLGAQVAGFAGRLFAKREIGMLGRITGLDPAAPCFAPSFVEEHVCKNVQGPIYDHYLTKEDAAFVDIIHTHGAYFGMIKNIGHADFYPNGGICQPGCLSAVVSCLYTDMCSHMRAVDLMVESIVNPRHTLLPIPETTYTLASKDAFEASKCSSLQEAKNTNCGDSQKANMGEYCDTKTRGIFGLETNRVSPFSTKYTQSWFEASRIIGNWFG